jgi:hypothetical protein
MADLTPLEEKLGEVIGLARAARDAGEKVLGLLDDSDGELATTLTKMKAEAEETVERATAVAKAREGDESGVLEQAEETHEEGVEMMQNYLDEDSDELDGFEFLIMAEAGEVGHWEILGKLNQKAGEAQVRDLVEWALPIQSRHFERVRAGALELAAEEDPYSA